MNFDSTPTKDASYASIASMANGSFCKACSLGKLGSRPSYAKDTKETIPFLQRIQGDICGPIHPNCGPFRYFMVLVDASTRWSHVALLSTRNAAYAKLLAQIIRLRAHHPVILLSQFVLTMLESLHHKHLMIIACLSGLMLSIPYPIYIHKMVSLKPLLRDFKWSLEY